MLRSTRLPISHRPSLIPSSSSYTTPSSRPRPPHARPHPSSCPLAQSAHLSTGQHRHPIHSTARVRAVPRKDQGYRREWWDPKGPAGGAGGVLGPMRDLMNGWGYREYAQARQLESQSRIPLTLPKLLEAFHALSNPPQDPTNPYISGAPQTPSRTAYILLLTAAATYSEQCRYLPRGGTGERYVGIAARRRRGLVDEDGGVVDRRGDGDELRVSGAEMEKIEEVWRRVIVEDDAPSKVGKHDDDETAHELDEQDTSSELLPLPPASSNTTFGLPSDRINLGLKIALCAYEDARLGGHDLGIEAFDLVLRAAAPYPPLIPHLMAHLRSTMAEVLPAWTADTIESSLRNTVRAGNLEDTLLVLSEARRRGIASELEKGYVARAIGTCCDWGYAKLALGLAEREEEGVTRVGAGGDGVGAMAWIEILRCSADLYFLEGVEKGWQRAVVRDGYQPDEGLCINILNVAGRYGLPDLATATIAKLAAQNIKIREHHLAPLLESFAHGGKMADAMEVLEVMRTSAGVSPTLATADPIVRILSGEDRSPEERTKILDTAFYALEALKLKGKRVDVAAYNAVLKASSNQRQYQRAIAIYQQAGSMGVRPNTETYNTLLAMCVKLKTRPHADALLKDMDNPKPLPTDPVDGSKPAPIKWDELTYETMISLCLTQNPYEDAFFFLEKMKSEKIRPPGIIYERIAAKLLSVNDPRYRAVLDEMQLNKYKPSTTLMRFDRMVKEGNSFSYDDLAPEALVGDWRKAIKQMADEAQPGGAPGGHEVRRRKQSSRGDGSRSRIGVRAAHS